MATESLGKSVDVVAYAAIPPADFAQTVFMLDMTLRNVQVAGTRLS
jgi:hypothetical protein